MKRGPEESPIPVSHFVIKSHVLSTFTNTKRQISIQCYLYRGDYRGDHLQGIYRKAESIPSGWD